MVHPFNPRHFAPGRYNQQNRSRICGHARRLQYVFPHLFPSLPSPCKIPNLPHTSHQHRSLICSSIAWLFELAGGAIGDFENSCLPKEQREAAFTVAALHQWDLDIDDPKCVSAAEDVGYRSLSCAALMIDEAR
jgi:hypothetical protein